MDAYLDIATTVLRSERRPLSPRSMIVAAYRLGIVPPHLYGKTQHKTLQARLSEDIVLRHERSSFFRTAPGRFFLREFLTDSSIPGEFRRPIPTRRRFRELVRGPALAMQRAALEAVAKQNVPIEPEIILSLLQKQEYIYDSPKRKSADSIFVRSFVCVQRDNYVLSYRQGKYREDRDAFMSRRSVGFATLVYDDDRNLFNLSDFGIVDAGVQAVIIDLDIPDIPVPSLCDVPQAFLSHFIWVEQSTGLSDLIAVTSFTCPEWFEPLKRRLALNDLRWIPCDRFTNNLEDYDPWSKAVTLMSKCYQHRQVDFIGPTARADRRRLDQVSESSDREWGTSAR